MAQPLVWSGLYATGIDVVDRQHQGLFAMVNELFALLDGGLAVEVGEGLVDRLVDYAAYHFRTEDQLMVKGGIDQDSLQQHRKEHAVFTRQILLWRSQLAHASPSLWLELASFLQSWLICHVLEVDVSMAREMQEISRGKSAAIAHEETELAGLSEAAQILASESGFVLSVIRASWDERFAKHPDRTVAKP